MAKTEAGIRRAEKAFVKLKADHKAGKVTAAVYRRAKEKLRADRADYRENVRDVAGWNPAKVGD